MATTNTGFQVKTLNVRLILGEELLGMSPADKDVYANYIASKSPDAETLEEELESITEEEALDNRKTIFPKLPNGTPFMWDYQIRGFFKEALSFLRKVPGTKASGIKAFKKAIDGLVFVHPRKIPFEVNGKLGDCQRPLRASTPMGERVALAASETIPAGSALEFTIEILDPTLEKPIIECLNYGAYHGIGQWRNSGKGTFRWRFVQG